MSIDLEVEVSGLNNADSQSLEVGEYGAEVAKEYADKLLSMPKVLKTAKILLKAGQKVQAHLQAKELALPKAGRIFHGSGQKVVLSLMG